MSEPSSYNDGLTMEQVARDWRDSLVSDAEKGELNSESAYGVDIHTVVRFTLAGGGPACYVEFHIDGDAEYWFEGEVIEATLTYLEPWKPAVTVAFSDEDAEQVFQALATPPDY